MKRQPVGVRKKIAQQVYKFLMSLPILNMGKRMPRQGRNTAGLLQTNVMKGASENPAKGGVENENVSDLVIRNEYVEVKAYDNIKAQIKIGRSVMMPTSNLWKCLILFLVSIIYFLYSLKREKEID